MTDKQSHPKLSFREAALRSGLVSARKLQKVVEMTGSEDEKVMAATLVKLSLIHI